MGIIAAREFRLPDGRICVVRSPSPSEGEPLRAFIVETFATTDTVLTCPDEFRLTGEQEAAFLAERANSPTGVSVVAEVEGKYVGIAGLEPVAKRRAQHNVSLGIMTAQAFRGVGVGHCLMQSLMDFARANPIIRRVQLEVVAANERAVKLYERHGFGVEGRRVGCFQRRSGVFEDDLIMACHVKS